MKFLELVNNRQSVRTYINKDVEKEKIIKCIEAARLAPSACNAQPWKFIIVNEKNTLLKIRNMIYDPIIGINKFALECKCFIIIVKEKRNLTSKIGEIVKKKDYSSIDIGIACEHICLQACELGLGTCIIGWFKENKIKEILNIPKNKEISLIISLGYDEMNIKRKKVRKDLNSIVTFNSYE
ncbi:nitroreductase family protein [Clostridium tarantellae]|uniref:NAD(P)H nitroreductase n=1 Tax=Clostridium tarantellae TaxID=39493 RepID=A0A6I1MMZ4_9CLOT|nr:nitroreductase family protein [Clostridium tarantellae]MPQ44765.1 NAD(P)H nitroreductase [Clostridium tarantellae]